MPKLTVDLFPNSGVHHYFVPIVFERNTPANSIQNFEQAYGLEVLNDNQLAEALTEEIRTNTQLWATADGENMQWLRYKLGRHVYTKKRAHNFHACTVLGIWLAIETATGTRTRGHIDKTTDSPNEFDEQHQEELSSIDEQQQISTPYAGYEANELYQWKNKDIVFDLLEHCKVEELSKNYRDIDLQLDIRWKEIVETGESIQVGLIIDLGNARTTVMGFEVAPKQTVTSDNLNQVCRPIYFFDKLQDAKSTYEMVGDKEVEKLLASNQYPDSWFVLQQPEFESTPNENMVYPDYIFQEVGREITLPGRFPWSRRRRAIKYTDELTHINWIKPQMFVKLSPALIGKQARDVFTRLNAKRMGLASLSSPKRYVWQTEHSGVGGETNWRMAKPDEEHTYFLSGDILRYMWAEDETTQFEKYCQMFGSIDDAYPAFEHEDLSARPDAAPTIANYSKSDSLIWLILSILETAWQQINSEGWRENHTAHLKRVLSDISFTFPPGWTREERKLYHQTWLMASKIFYWSRFPYRDEHGEIDIQEPELIRSIDEAVAAQLPIVFSAIKQLQNNSRAWCSLYGKQRNTKQSVRVLSLDIGGGTTDTAVVEYIDDSDDRQGVALRHQLLFSDSSSIAGDNLLFDIINNFILPHIAKPYLNDSLKFDAFQTVLSNSVNNVANRTRNVLLIKTVFTPLVIKWFEDFTNQQQGSSKTQQLWSIEEVTANEGNKRDVYANVENFNILFREVGLDNVLNMKDPFEIDYAKLDSFITEWVEKIANSSAKFVASLDCDLVIVSGKTSELPQVKKVLAEKLPVSHQNLIFVHNHYVGNWFPGSKKGRITDAKLVTVTGAALFYGIKKGFINGWSLSHVEADQYMIIKNYWGVLNQSHNDVITDDELLLCPEEDPWQVTLNIGDMIGRTKFLYTSLEPIYKLQWAKDSPYNELHNRSIEVTLTRVVDDNIRPPSEHLELTDVRDVSENGEVLDISTKDVNLKLQTLKDEVYWLDSGKLDVGILNELQEGKSNG